MAPTPRNAGTVVSSNEVLNLETSTLLQHSSEPDLGAQNERSSVPPPTPEALGVIKDRRLFQKVFEENMKNKLAPVKHAHGHVLLLSWEENIDDLKVESEVEQLKTVFTNSYGFDVIWKKLGSQSPTRQLNLYLASFMHDHDKENTLLIIYYAGHGVYENNSVNLQATTGQQTESEKLRNRIAWSGAENNISGSVADILVIFDCCEAGGFGGYKVRSSKPHFDFIAACGRRERTRHPGKQSFTSALMWSLGELQDLAPFTSINLVEKIKDYEHLPDTQTPELLRREQFADGPIWISPLVNGPEPEAVLKSESPNPRNEFIDLRFRFHRRVKLEDATNLAKHLSRLVNDEDSFAAKHISLLDRSSTFSDVVTIWRKSSAGTKRKCKCITLTGANKDMLNQGEIGSPIFKRQRRETTFVEIPRAAAENQGAFFHLRMFLNHSLQSLGSSIGRVADRIHPPMLEQVESSESVNVVKP